MKTPQRRFVVEFKSGRRQPKAQTNSIWGDTDLKALSREVEDTAPHLFNSNEGPGTIDSDATRPADPLNAESVRADDVDVARAAIAFANGVEVGVSKHNEANHTAEAVVQVQESQPPSAGTPRKSAKRAAAQTIAHNSKLGHEGRRAEARPIENPISVDELATLDADNKRLKRLLAEHLRAQNLWLKKMLERFDAE